MSLLMDSIADAALTIRRVKQERDPILAVYPQIAQKLQGTPRYLFDEDAIHTAVELTLGRPKVLLEAMRYLRIPYPRMWIEWPETGRAKLREIFDYTDNLTNARRPLPQRLGFLIECTDDSGRRGQATWCWASPEMPGNVLSNEPLSFPNVGVITPYFDLDAQIEQSAERITGFLRGNLAKLWQGNQVQLDALIAIWRTAHHAPSQWGLDYLATIQDRGANIEEHLKDVFADVYGEYIIIWAILLLLTASRKTVEYTAVDRSKLNKARAKQHRALLFDHTEVTIHIGDAAQQIAGERRQPLGYTRKSPRIHMVGRFLNRRGDKHWLVEPFMRGSGEMIHRQVRVKQ